MNKINISVTDLVDHIHDSEVYPIFLIAQKNIDILTIIQFYSFYIDFYGQITNKSEFLICLIKNNQKTFFMILLLNSSDDLAFFKDYSRNEYG